MLWMVLLPGIAGKTRKLTPGRGARLEKAAGASSHLARRWKLTHTWSLHLYFYIIHTSSFSREEGWVRCTLAKRGTAGQGFSQCRWSTTKEQFNLKPRVRMSTRWTMGMARPWQTCWGQGRRCKHILEKAWRQPSAKSTPRNQLIGLPAFKTATTQQQAFTPPHNTALAWILWPATSPQLA